MGQTFLSDDFRFFSIHFQNYHYTDARNGCDLHFLALLIKGSARIVCEDRILEIHEGEAFYFPKGLRYQSYWYGQPDVHFLSFGFSTMPAGDMKSYILQTIPDPDLPELLKRIPTPGRQVDSHTLSLFYGALAQATVHMACEPAQTGSQLANAAAAFMRRNPYAPIPEVASACGVSQPHLYATFREAMGTTPNDYRQSVLCQMAVELLTTTDKTVEEVSDLLRFSSAAYFRKVLRKHTGLTPKQIRQKSIY